MSVAKSRDHARYLGYCGLGNPQLEEAMDFVSLPSSRETPGEPFGTAELPARGPGLGEGVEDGNDLT